MAHHPDRPDVEETTNDPRTISQVRLQLGVSNAVARLGLSDTDSERLCGILCGRVDQWVKNVYEAECQNHKELPTRPRKYDKVVEL